MIYVAGYYVKNFYLIRQPAFLCAEILLGDQVVAATGSSAKNEEQLIKEFEAKQQAED